MQKHKDEIIMIKDKIPFAEQAEVRINEKESVLDSSFPVDRQVIENNLKLYDGRWELGELPQGHEWLAFTFQSQDYQMTQEEYNELFENSEKIVNDAYNRMNFTKQPWNRHQTQEASFILERLKTRNIKTVMDFGCGNGRHTLEFASKGYHCIGIDYSKKKISEARKKCGFSNTKFVDGDCRNIKLSEKADLALCLYDVVGSFARDEDNRAIVRNIYQHLNAGAVLVLSVMNLELTEHIAIHKVPVVSEHLDELARLKPSKIMQNSGNIFAPEYFLLETNTGIVYRKEQFENEDELSAEYVIRDKRYHCDEICKLLESEGFHVLDKRYVQAGKWEKTLQPQDKSAKEIFYQDYKKFSVNNVAIGVGQINSMSAEELEKVKPRLAEFIQGVVQDNSAGIVYFLLTDIVSESSEVLCAGNNANAVIYQAFGVEVKDACVKLQGVVSRKKQFFPAIVEALQQ